METEPQQEAPVKRVRKAEPTFKCNDPVLLYMVSVFSFWVTLFAMAMIGGPGVVMLLSATVYLYTRKLRGKDIY